MQAGVNIFRKLQFFFMKLWSLCGVDSSWCDHCVIYYKPPSWSLGLKEERSDCCSEIHYKIKFFF